MGQPAATIGSLHVCPKTTGIVPHVGGPTVAGSGAVKLVVYQQHVWVISVYVLVRQTLSVQAPVSRLMINGKPAARMGDATAHGGKIVIGNPTVLIG